LSVCDHEADTAFVLRIMPERTMYKQILIAVLAVLAARAAFAKDLPPMGAETEESGSRATLDIIDQKKIIKLTCEGFEVQVSPTEDRADSASVVCDAAINANSPLLWEYTNKKQRLEKAVVSYKTGKGQPYTIEVPNALIEHLSVTDATFEINISAASSRVIVPPGRQ
jgi:hypothetical protein